MTIVHIQPIECPHDQQKEHNQINVAQGLGEEHRRQVVLVRKLAEHGGGGAPHGIAEIHGVAEIHGQGQSVDNQINPAAQRVISLCLLTMPWQQHQHHVGDVGDQYGRRVEHQSATEHLHQMTERKILGKITVVDQQIGDTRQEIDHVEQQQIANRCRQRREQT